MKRLVIGITTLALVAGIVFVSLSVAGAHRREGTIRGAIGGDFDTQLPAGGTVGADWGVDQQLTVPATTLIRDDDVFVVGTGEAGEGTISDPGDANECPGTISKPRAAPGNVCIYLTQSDNATNIEGLSIMPGSGGSRFGFKLLWDAETNGDTFVDAVWAYRFP